MLCRWFFTVCSLMNIFSAISLFLKPCATSATISRSRWLSGERSRSRVGRGLRSGGGGGGASSFGHELPDDRRRGVRIEPDLAGMHLADALDEQLRGGLLENDARGPELHRLDKLVLVVGGGQHDHSGLVAGGLQPLQRGETVEPRHLQVEQQDVGLAAAADISSTCRAVLRLRDDLEILFQGQQPAQAVAEDRMVVRHHDPDLGLRRRDSLRTAAR